MINLDGVIADTQALIGIDSQNPGPLEGECADWLERRITGMGLPVTRHEVEPGRDNLIATTVRGSDPDAPRLVILAHMDTVPVGEGWTYPPFGGVIADDRIYGRGACDMKAGLALGLGLIEAASRGATPPRCDVLLVMTVDEEAPAMLGAHQLVQSGLLRPSDQVLAPEPTGMRLRLAQMGLRWLTVRVHGRMAHAGRAHLGIDANQVLAQIVDRLRIAVGSLPFDDELLGRPRFTCGTFNGGLATNVVPPVAEAQLDLRIVPPLVPEDTVAIVERVADAVLVGHPEARYEIELLGARRPPVRAAEDSKIVSDLRAAYRLHSGAEPEVGGADGHEAYTDASMVAALTGSDSCTVLGPGATDQAHTVDEYVPIADLELGAQVLWTMLRGGDPAVTHNRLPRAQLPSVAEVLQFDTLMRGDPVVVAGAAGLARTVRWVHVSEIATIGDLLKGGEMILTTGIALPEDVASLGRYIDQLAEAEVAAIVVGLGPHFQDPLPRAMLEAADRHELPLIALRRKTAFVDVTEEVHSRLVDIQVEELQASENIHTIFSDLAVQGSKPEAVLRQVARLSECSVVLENLTHEVLAFDTATRDRQDVLAEWTEHTRRARTVRSTGYDPRTGWLMTTVGARGQNWGRLILMAAGKGNRVAVADADPMMSLPRSMIMLVERAASALALSRLLERDRAVLELHTHRSLLTGLLSADQLNRDIALESAAVGVPLEGHSVVALALRRSTPRSPDPLERQSELRTLSAELAEKLKARSHPALVGPVDEETVAAVVALPSGLVGGGVLEDLAGELGTGEGAPIVGIAGPTVGVAGARQILAEAVETVAAASVVGSRQGYVRSSDLGLNGLLLALLDDPRVQRFSETYIGPLLRHDEDRGTNLVALLRHYLSAGRNKTVAARTAFVSRPWMYERLALISSVLDTDLEDEDSCVTLQVALMAHDLRQKKGLI